MSPAWLVDPLVSVGSFLLGVGWAVYLIRQPEDVDRKGKP